MTRCLTVRTTISSCEDLVSIALGLRDRVNLPPQELYRRAGVGLSNFLLEDDEADEAEGSSLREAPVELLLQSQAIRAAVLGMNAAAFASENHAPLSISGISMRWPERKATRLANCAAGRRSEPVTKCRLATLPVRTLTRSRHIVTNLGSASCVRKSHYLSNEPEPIPRNPLKPAPSPLQTP